MRSLEKRIDNAKVALGVVRNNYERFKAQATQWVEQMELAEAAIDDIEERIARLEAEAKEAGRG